ncbi:hypothetical protein D3C78_792140 [compost metagenome]
MQRPDAEHVVDLPAVLGGGEGPDEQRTGNRPGEQRTDRVHQVGTGADRDQTGQRAVVQEAGVVAADQQRRQGAADHGQQRVDRHQAADALQGLRTHHVEAEPADDQDPRAQRQERDVRRREGHQLAVAVAAVAVAEQQHGRQRQPATDPVHHHRAGEVVEGGAEARLQPGLHAEVAVPDQPLEERVDEGDDQHGRAQLRAELRALGDPAGDDRRNRRGEGQQEEELHQRVAVVGAQYAGRLEKGHPVGDPVADEEVGQRRDREIGKDLRQRVDLVLLPHGADLEEGKAGVHGQDHDRTEQDEQGVGAVNQGFHGTIEVFHRRSALL